MHARTHVLNPFVMLVDPAPLLKAIDESVRLKAISGRVYRPLEQPTTARSSVGDGASFDTEIGRSRDDGDFD